MSVQRDSFYYFDTLMIIQVEDTLFRVPRKEFEEESEAFASLFSLPPGSEEGLSDEHPLYLEGVTADEFRCFLRAANPKHVLSSELLDDEELENALRLATMWGFLKLREVLIRNLESLTLKPARYLQLAQAYDIPKWYKNSLRLLALRHDSLTEEEGIQLGGELAAIVSILRDQRFDAISYLDFGSGRRHSTGEEILTGNQSTIQHFVNSKLKQICKSRGWDGKVGKKVEKTVTEAT